MATQASPLAAPTPALPDYLQSAKPNPVTNRAPWYKNTAPTYAGIFLWFAFWDEIAFNGLGTSGLALTLLGVVIAAVICHFLFYLVPGLLGMRTGLPLYIVGSSTFGAVGGLLMPGFLMGLLQFGWLAVNTYYSSRFLAKGILGSYDHPSFTPVFYALCVLWAAGAAFVGLKGIQYVAKVATYLPLIPLAVLILALVTFAGEAAGYQPPVPRDIEDAGNVSVLTGNMMLGMFAMIAAIVGFFATAGAAGVDFGMNSRNTRDVQVGGLVGILLAIIFTAGASTIAVAGAHEYGILNGSNKAAFTLTNALEQTFSPGTFRLIMIGLPIAAFPGACFSSFIAANSFKTVMPRVNSFLSVGLGTVVSIILAVKGWAGELGWVFGLIGASFGPICGAMMADYFLAGRKWVGPRAGFNWAGWVAWLLGFIVGIMPQLHDWDPRIPNVAAAPVAAFFVGLIVYYILAKAGLQTAVIPYGPAAQQQLPENASAPVRPVQA